VVVVAANRSRATNIPSKSRTHVPNHTCSHLPATVITEAYSDGADEVSQAIILRIYVYMIVITTQLRIRCPYRAVTRAVREQFDVTKTALSLGKWLVRVASTADRPQMRSDHLCPLWEVVR
jgi:hypothetical protein